MASFNGGRRQTRPRAFVGHIEAKVYLASLGHIDRRIGIMGGSYGGY